jgi:hypothetical protein
MIINNIRIYSYMTDSQKDNIYQLIKERQLKLLLFSKLGSFLKKGH